MRPSTRTILVATASVLLGVLLSANATPFAAISVDGNAGDWTGIDPLLIDPQGDSLGGPNADIFKVYTAMNATYAFVMVETYGKPIHSTATIELYFNYQAGQQVDHGPYDDLGVNIWEDTMGAVVGDENYPLDGTIVVRGNVMEAAIPLSEIGNPAYFYATFVNIWASGAGNGDDPSSIHIAEGNIQGGVSYAGSQTGQVIVAAFLDASFESDPDGMAVPSPAGDYAIQNINPGVYYLASVMLTDPAAGVDGMKITDPWGVHGTRESPTPVVVGAGATVAGKDIQLVDGTSENPNRFVDAPPALSWTAEPQYTSDGLHPEEGDNSTLFEYRVTYADPDDEAPQSGYPRVHVLLNGVEIAESPFAMSEADTAPYETGRKYSRAMTLMDGTNYTYFFEACDGHGAVAGGQPTMEQAGPEVISNQEPTLTWTEEPGYLDDGLDPEEGDASTVFEYRVKYTDPDGDLPKNGYPKVHVFDGGTAVDGSPFSMAEVEATPITGGRKYSALLTLRYATNYSYRFEAFDIHDAAAVGTSTNLLFGPTVTPTYRLTQISAGDFYSLALNDDGTVWGWGYNSAGQLGDGTTTERHEPVQVVGLSGVSLIVAGSGYPTYAAHSVALKSDGTVWTWGANGHGQLGDGTTTSRYTPTPVPGMEDVVQVGCCAGRTFVLMNDGSVWGWGIGDWGDGTWRESHDPVQASIAGVTAIAVGGGHTLALKTDGTVWAWGDNATGQLGNGTYDRSYIPVRVLNLDGVQQIAAGFNHSAALKSDGTLWTWGHNQSGALADRSGISYRNYAAQCAQIPSVQDLSALGWHTVVATSAGEYWDNGYPWGWEGFEGIESTAVGQSHHLALTEEGILWAAGQNGYGQLGDGTTTFRGPPVLIDGFASSASAAIVVLARPLEGGTVSGGGTYDVGSEQQISATANATWHFVNWNDGSTANPRTITVPAGGATYMANFTHDQATLTVTANPSQGGTVSGDGTFDVGSEQQISATANATWHFVNWNDGSTLTTRTITVPAAGASYTANFSRDQVTISVVAKPTQGGTVSGGGTFDVGSQQQISATENTDWHFVDWNDGSTQNPRMVTVGADGATYTANFERDTGALLVGINPSAAADAGARWSIDGGATWHSSGDTRHDLPTGDYSVTFKDISGWTTPANRAATVSKDVTTIMGGTYVQDVGSLRVNISPPAAVSAGAQWSIDGGASWHSSGYTRPDLPIGNYSVTFKILPSWYKPSNMAAVVYKDQTTTAAGAYSPHFVLRCSKSLLSPIVMEGGNAASQSFEIWNDGAGSMSYTVADDSSWMWTDKRSGASSGEHDSVTVYYNTSHLDPGTYEAAITVTASSADGSPETVVVRLTVDESSWRLQNYVEPCAFEATPTYDPDDGVPNLFEVRYKIHYRVTYLTSKTRTVSIRANAAERDLGSNTPINPDDINTNPVYFVTNYLGTAGIHDYYFAPPEGYFAFLFYAEDCDWLCPEGSDDHPFDLEWTAYVTLSDNGDEETWYPDDQGDPVLDETKASRGSPAGSLSISDAEGDLTTLGTYAGTVSGDAVPDADHGMPPLGVDVTATNMAVANFTNILAVVSGRPLLAVEITPPSAEFEPPAVLTVNHRDWFGNPRERALFFTSSSNGWTSVVTDYNRNEEALAQDDTWTAAVRTGGVYLLCHVDDGDLDIDGMNDGWEARFLGGADIAGQFSDYDSDGLSDRYEFLSQTDPTNALSCIRIVSADLTNPTSACVLRWYSISNRSYSVSSCTNLQDQFSVTTSNIWATYPVNLYTGDVSSGRARFFRVELEDPDYDPDITPPAEVSGFTANAGDNAVALNWTNPPDEDFDRVILRRRVGSPVSSATDATLLYEGSAESYLDDAVTNGTTFHYRVFTVDDVGNVSAGVTATATPVDPPTYNYAADWWVSWGFFWESNESEGFLGEGTGNRALYQLVYTPDEEADVVATMTIPPYVPNDVVIAELTVQEDGEPGGWDSFGYMISSHRTEWSTTAQDGYIYVRCFQDDSFETGDWYYGGPLVQLSDFSYDPQAEPADSVEVYDANRDHTIGDAIDGPHSGVVQYLWGW